MRLNSDARNLFLASKAVAERNGFGYVPEIIGLGTLAMMKDSPLHRYFLNQNLEHKEIVEKVTEMYKKYFPYEEERVQKYAEIIQSAQEATMAEPSAPEYVVLTGDDFKKFEGSFVTIKLRLDSGKTEQVNITKELYGILVMAMNIAKNMYKATALT